MSEAERPTPEQMLARLRSEPESEEPREGRPRRGRLKVYFGYAPGVGKTYSMLQEAQRLKAGGKDVVVGYVEPHGRPETEILLEGLDAIPPLSVTYANATLKEFDLDGALARGPEILLVDELAHTNPPGLRHPKRWQDVEELLDAGIDVHSTCNVQHIESLNDVIAKISGVVVRETVPDEVFERADEIALVDLTPENLLERIKEGKVYVPAQAQRALTNFFKRENLVALRELALRRTAERVHEDVALARKGSASKRAWATRERLLVGVSASPTSAQVLRAAKRLADSLDAEWIALHVDVPASAGLRPEDRSRLVGNLRLAERLGAEVETIVGEDLVDETIAYARQRNVTKIVIGKTDPSRARRLRTRRTIADRLLDDSGDIDVYVVRGIGAPIQSGSPAKAPAFKPGPWLETVGILAVASAVALSLHLAGLSEANLVMTYLLAVVVVAFRCGRLPSIFASIASVILFDVVFTEPYWTVAVHDLQYLVTFGVMSVVGLATAAMASRQRVHADIARRNEARTAALYRLGRKLAGISGSDFLAAETERSIAETFGVEAVVFLPDDGALRPIIDHKASFAAEPSEVGVAQWAFDHEQVAGHATDTLPSAKGLYVPLAAPGGAVGVLGVRGDDMEKLLLPDARQLLEAFAAQVALAMERDRLTLASASSRVEAETEKVRSTLLASVSHDLRTPLAVIAGASSSLLDGAAADDPQLRRELLESVREEAERLSRLVENVLRYAQLSSGKFRVEKEWHPLEEIVGSTLHRLETAIGDRPVEVNLPDDLLLVYVDAVLIEQVLINLVENACRYSPRGAPIRIAGRQEGRRTVVEVADQGPGIPSEETARIFGSFERGSRTKSDTRGAGLGLSICKTIIDAHGGKIEALTREGIGAIFRFSLPSPPRPRTVEPARATSGEGAVP